MAKAAPLQGDETVAPNGAILSPIGSAPARDAIEIPSTLPILPLRGTVVFPGTIVPLTIRRAVSIRLLDDSLPQSKIVGLVAQRNDKEELTPDDLHPMGVAGKVLKLLRQKDETLVIVVEAVQRIRVERIAQSEPYIRAYVEAMPSNRPPADDPEFQALINNLRESAVRLVELAPEIPDQAKSMLAAMEDPEQLADFLAGNLNLDVRQKQDLLEELDLVKRIRAIQLRVSAQLEIAELQQKLRDDVQAQMTDFQRRAYLREQIKAIQRELGEGEEGADHEIEELRKRLEDSKAPKQVMEHAERELKRLRYIPTASPEFTVIVSYLETIAGLPWSVLTPENIDLKQAQQILDRDHYDLEKIKRRLIEYLAVRKLNPEGHGPII